jgi:hypothetical protein
MKQEDNKLQIKEKIEDLNRQVLELKNQVVEPSVKNSFDSLISDMEKTRDLIQKKYDNMEASGEDEWTKLEKNIFNDVESFDKAYKKAGALFKPRQ